VGQIFAENAGKIFLADSTPEQIRNSMQALIFAATMGVGLFLGTQFAGIVMDKFKKDNKFEWSKVFAVPAVITLVSILALIFLFKVQS
jgi:MFS family permease